MHPLPIHQLRRHKKDLLSINILMKLQNNLETGKYVLKAMKIQNSLTAICRILDEQQCSHRSCLQFS